VNANPQDPSTVSNPGIQPGNTLPAPAQNPDSRIQGGSIRLFRVAGIDVLLHWSWFFFAVLRFQPSGSDDPLEFAQYDSQIWFVIEYIALFGIVLLHEFGHVLACRSVGGIANRIVLWPLGGIALVDPPPRPGPVLWSIAAGPLVNAILLAPTIGFWLLCHAIGLQDTAPDVYQFAWAIAWINGYLLVFNLLPVYPLDGGRILQALLWFVMGRARSLMVATAVGLFTAVGLLVLAIVERSLVWAIIAGFGVLFCLIGLQGARALFRMLAAPRRQEANCPDCGASPPIGKFWACMRCFSVFDAFATGGNCPNCSTPLAAILCPECGRTRPYKEWHILASPSDAVAVTPEPVPTPAVSAPPPPTSTPRPPTVTQRILWGGIFALFGLALCGAPSAENQPLGLVIWPVGGAILGATSAGALTRMWKNNQARRKLRGTWRLVELDGQPVLEGAEVRRLKFNYPYYQDRIGNQEPIRGACWTDALAEIPAISFTPKAGPDAGKPRQGIYRLDGKTFTLCLAYAEQPRPTAFVSLPNVQEVRVFRRGGKRMDKV
jgi:uncharacterized protein (TIGR03067 family)